MNKYLKLSTSDKKLCGVCGGFAEYFELDSSLVRILWTVLTFFTAWFPGIILYIICFCILGRDNNISMKQKGGNNCNCTQTLIIK